MQPDVLRIVFMGTPDFAVASLEAMEQAGFFIAGVVTAPDKPAGRSMKTQESAVKQYARKRGLPILQPVKLKDAGFLESLRSLRADLQVVVAFRMLPAVVWNMPRLGTINLHASLLPQFRGAAPIHWAIIHGEKETGVTTFKLQEQIDTGNILFTERIPIAEEETAGELHDRLKAVGAAVLVKTVASISEGTALEHPQSAIVGENSGALKQAPKIFTATCQINWLHPVDEVFNLVRGLSPHPAAFTLLHNKMLKIYKAKKEQVPPAVKPGDFETDGKTFLKFACTDGYLLLKDVQMEGKKRMLIEEFLRGFRPAAAGSV